jgi:hypothetical protein
VWIGEDPTVCEIGDVVGGHRSGRGGKRSTDRDVRKDERDRDRADEYTTQHRNILRDVVLEIRSRNGKEEMRLGNINAS